jgi:CCR4-NOT transcription complex subunit 1
MCAVHLVSDGSHLHFVPFHSSTRALLESDRAITQTNERTLIKQLGSWLGLLTFAKNKPVLAKDMDLKQLIADAYTRGRMIAVLPFVEKVLSGCKDTKVRRAAAGAAAGVRVLVWF